MSQRVFFSLKYFIINNKRHSDRILEFERAARIFLCLSEERSDELHKNRAAER